MVISDNTFKNCLWCFCSLTIQN